MKRFIVLICLTSFTKILSNRINLSSYTACPVTFIGDLKFPNKVIEAGFCVYFNGSFISVEEGSFIFRSSTDKINILITDPKNIEIRTEENNLATLILKDNSSYYFYFISRKFLGRECTWEVQNIKAQVFNNVTIIPLNTLIIPISTQFVDKELENKKFKMSTVSLKLPSIIVKGEKDKINQEILRSCMAFVDFKPFHSKQKTKEVKSDNLTVSMIVE